MYKHGISKEVHADMIVFGGGPSGLAAAITAARAGKQVILIEVQGKIGGVPSKTGNEKGLMMGVSLTLYGYGA